MEQLDYEKSWVVQYPDGSLRPFLRDKLLVSIYKSCQHRPSALEDALGLTATALSQARNHAQAGAVPAVRLAAVTHGILKRFDNAAATHYQAFHADVLP